MKILANNKSRKSGFSLLELSIVLVIIGILVYGSSALYTVSVDAARAKQVETTLTAIERALRLHQQTVGDLPCPADGTLVFGDANYGLSVESPEGTCSSNSYTPTGAYGGVVPTRTLNLPDNYAIDPWGYRITYVVDDACVDNADWAGCASGAGLTVQDNSGGSTRTAAYVLVSHGENGTGAYYRSGGATRVPLTGSTSAEEDENAHVLGDGTHGTWDTEFRDDFVHQGEVGNYFDDYVRWKVPAQITYED